ncbi:MAG: zinc dependent phospholipase C family protein [Lachnospirales bacterium]
MKIPGLVTHLIGGEIILKNTEMKYQGIIENYKEAYYIGSQGPDLFFYDFLTFFKKDTRNLGQILHKQNINRFFGEMVREAKAFPTSMERQIAFSYIAGYITHYTLDINTHPYIYYKSGFSKKGRQPFQLRYSLLHRKLESNIDNMIHEAFTENGSPRDEKIWHLVEADDKQTDVIAKLLSKSISVAYDRNVTVSDVKLSLKMMMYAIKALNLFSTRGSNFKNIGEDLKVCEKQFTNLIEGTCNSPLDFLNLKKGDWCSPWNDTLVHETSFVDLYSLGLNEGIGLVNNFGLFVDEKISYQDFLELVQNRSLKTGVDSDLDIIFKYHDIIFNK